MGSATSIQEGSVRHLPLVGDDYVDDYEQHDEDFGDYNEHDEDVDDYD